MKNLRENLVDFTAPVVKTFKIQNDDPKNTFSRYKNLKKVLFKDGTICQETPNPIEIPFSKNDKFHIVEHNEVGRLDIISYRYYNTSKLWWAIATASNISDPFSIKLGMRLRIPDKASLLKTKGVLA